MSQKLVDGYKRFRNEYFESNKEYLKNLANGQFPHAAVLSCCDSRVDPTTIFDAAPGELFVIRNIANLIPPIEIANDAHGTIAALEFAISVLQVKDLLILGHDDCGGIKALLNSSSESKQNNSFIDNWMNIAASIKDKVLDTKQPTKEQYIACEQDSIALSLKNLMSYPWVSSRVKEGKLKLHGWHYIIEEGALLQFDPKLNKFFPL